ncbi:hypothetical protein D9758_004941 [Tetrapyrgos nigripes]|uniref:Uncharacterized protein n=1 Tax=Tetrapyrgos nigripes TaxID=182062 RepID=A0A8H5GWD1_9AGAR|nr:hypothetical protein D9758_004941 [Tetrapyrgos nigripes]
MLLCIKSLATMQSRPGSQFIAVLFCPTREHDSKETSTTEILFLLGYGSDGVLGNGICSLLWIEWVEGEDVTLADEAGTAHGWGEVALASIPMLVLSDPRPLHLGITVTAYEQHPLQSQRGFPIEVEKSTAGVAFKSLRKRDVGQEDDVGVSNFQIAEMHVRNRVLPQPPPT